MKIKNMRLLAILGTLQIFHWGTLYYSIAVLSYSIKPGLALSDLDVFSGVTVGLITSAIAAPAIGTWIDKGYSRRIFTTGCIWASIALLTLATSQSYAVYLIGWLMIGIAMSMCLYEPVFAFLSTLRWLDYRRSATVITIFGSFASTVFWPVTEFLMVELGWRETLIIFAVGHILALPAYFAFLPSSTRRPLFSSSDQETVAAGTINSNNKETSFVLLIVAISTSTFIFSVISVYLIELLSFKGFDRSDVLWLGAVIGPSQAFGRLLDFKFGHQTTVAVVAYIALSLLLLSTVLLWSMPDVLLLGCIFSLLYGISNGTMTVVRAALPLEVFRTARSGHLLGTVARFSLLSKAFAPAVFSITLVYIGSNLAMATLVVFAATAVISFAFLYRNHYGLLTRS